MKAFFLWYLCTCFAVAPFLALVMELHAPAWICLFGLPLGVWMTSKLLAYDEDQKARRRAMQRVREDAYYEEFKASKSR